MKRFLLFALLSLAIMFTSVTASSFIADQGIDFASFNEEEPYPWTKKP